MRLVLARYVVLLGLAVGCGATTQSLRSEYALDPGAHPESVDCFYSCLRVVEDDLRRSCLSLCDGVEVNETYQACASGAPTLCRSYPVREPFPTYANPAEDDGQDIAGDIMGAIFVGIIEVALGVDDDDDDDDDDDQRVRAERPKRDSTPRVERAPKPAVDRRGRPRKGK
jgi:hypothetical protein